MAEDSKTELESFHSFVAEQLAGGEDGLLPEEVLARWREKLNTSAAIQEGLQAVSEGKTLPLDEFLTDYSERHQLV